MRSNLDPDPVSSTGHAFVGMVYSFIKTISKGQVLTSPIEGEEINTLRFQVDRYFLQEFFDIIGYFLVACFIYGNQRQARFTHTETEQI